MVNLRSFQEHLMPFKPVSRKNLALWRILGLGWAPLACHLVHACSTLLTGILCDVTVNVNCIILCGFILFDCTLLCFLSGI